MSGVERGAAPTLVSYSYIGESTHSVIGNDGAKKVDADPGRCGSMLSFLFLRRFWRITKILLFRRKRVAFPMLLLLLAILVVQEFVINFLGQVPSQFYKVLLERNREGFMKLVLLSIEIVTTVALANSAKAYLTNCVSVVWREELTWRLHKQYFRNANYYHVNRGGNEDQNNESTAKMDNTDQRLTSDVNSLCVSLANVVSVCVIVPLLVVYYSFQAARIGWIAPVSCFLFFIAFAVLNGVTILFVAPRVYAVDKREGDFRFAHAHTRKCAESIAFVDGDAAEYSAAQGRFAVLIKAQRALFVRQFGLQSIVEFANYLASILSYVLVGFAVFGGAYDDKSDADLSAAISQMSFAVMYLINCFTRVLAVAVQAAIVVGSTHRIGELLEQFSELEDSAANRGWLLSNDPLGVNVSNATMATRRNESSDSDGQQDAPQNVAMHTLHETLLVCKQLSVKAPGGREALKSDLCFSVKRGENLLVCGPSGCGKTSLFRVLRGLWSASSGQVQRFVSLTPDCAAFVAQVPYFMLDASVRQLILYPLASASSSCSSSSDAAQQQSTIEALVDFCELKKTLLRIGGLDVKLPDAAAVLSPGEQQRLVFCRLLFHRPSVAFLDESTSQISVDMETKLYNKCTESGITLVSIGHRESLRKFHQTFVKF